MFSILRGGSKLVLIESNKKDELKDYLKCEFNIEESNIINALEISEESYTVVCIVNNFKEIINQEDIQYAFAIKYECDKLLCKILRENKSYLINNIRMAPRIILMKAFGDIDCVIEEIKKDYNGVISNFEDVMDKHNDEGTAVAFVKNPLNRNAQLKDLYDNALFIEENYYSLLKNLRINGLKYLNEGLHNKDWYEFEIKIYDIYDQYELHYTRLLKVIQALELGFIIGESWGKDYPRPLMSVGVYRLKFLTFYEPEYIKKILVGLEHLEDGTRVVDYDIFYRRKKIYWFDAAKKEHKDDKNFKVRKLKREEYAVEQRHELFSKMDESDKKEIFDIEVEIEKINKV